MYASTSTLPVIKDISFGCHCVSSVDPLGVERVLTWTKFSAVENYRPDKRVRFEGDSRRYAKRKLSLKYISLSTSELTVQQVGSSYEFTRELDLDPGVIALSNSHHRSVAPRPSVAVTRCARLMLSCLPDYICRV